MSNVTTDSATTLAPVELRPETANLPAITEDRPLVALAKADPAKAARVKAMMGEVDIKDTNSVVTFGASANRELTSISEKILGTARNKEFGEAGNLINSMVAEIRGFAPQDIGRELSWWQRVIRRLTPILKAIQRYETVQSHLRTICSNLDRQKTVLMKHIALQDRMEASSHKALDAIEEYIAAGEAVIVSWTENDLAEAEQAASTSDDARLAQVATNIRNQIRLMERTVHSLKMTRQVTLQSIPRINLLQDNDANLVTKIDGLFAHAIPMWKQQLAEALMIQQMNSAAGAIKSASDLTNELLEQNAAGLKDASAKVRTEIERSVIDIESVEKANNLLIQTLQEAVQIYEAGRKTREEAETRLVAAEKLLKEAMMEHKDRMNAG